VSRERGHMESSFYDGANEEKDAREEGEKKKDVLGLREHQGTCSVWRQYKSKLWQAGASTPGKKRKKKDGGKRKQGVGLTWEEGNWLKKPRFKKAYLLKKGEETEKKSR